MPAKEKYPPLRGYAKKFFNYLKSQGLLDSDSEREGEPKRKPEPEPEPEPWQPPPFRKKFYFFYGTLMDLATLTKVLHLKEPPNLVPATITGHHCKLWGPYPALLDGPCDAKVQGVAFEVQSAEQVKLLKDYETGRYMQAGCRIQLLDGSSVLGATFVWRSDDHHELHDGVFDLKDYQMKQAEMDMLAEQQEASASK